MPNRAYFLNGTKLPLGLALVFAVLGAFSLNFAFPDAAIWPLVFPAMILFFSALFGRGLWSAALIGTVFGATFYLTHMSWLLGYLGPVPWLALSILETLFITASAVLIVICQRSISLLKISIVWRWLLVAVLTAFIWTAQEIVSGSWPYSGFPWARLGVSQSNSPLAELASYGGISLLSFVIALISASVAGMFFAKKLSKKLALIMPAALLGLLLFVPQAATAAVGSIRVGSVQGNGPSAYFDQRERGDVLRAQLETSMELYGEDLDLVVWPEGGIDSDPLMSEGVAVQLDALSRNLDAPLLVNAATQRGEEIFNTSILWEAGLGPVAMHDKVNPVPFGEYVPDRWFFEMLAPDLVGLIKREYSPGQNEPFMSFVSKQGSEVGIGLAICFDVLYDDVIYRSIHSGAQFLVFQTNNADFRGTSESAQQLAVARMRAIETGRSVVNISTIGTSQVIGSDGSIRNEIPADVSGVMADQIELRNGITPAVFTAGVIEDFVLSVTLVSLIAMIALGLLNRRAKKS